MLVEKVLKWLKILTIPFLLVAVTVAYLSGITATEAWIAACTVLLGFWLGPKGVQLVKGQAQK